MAISRWYPTENITVADYADDLMLLASTHAQAKSLLHSLKHIARDIGLYMNSNKTYEICFNQNGAMPSSHYMATLKK